VNVLLRPVAEPSPSRSLLRKFAAGSYRIVSRLSARKPVSEAVATRVKFKARPEAVWDHMMLYEEVPGRPPLLLRTLLPHPLRTEGDKTRVGSTVRCVYRGGDLVKRITTVVSPHSLQFEVIEQSLGIEDCIRTRGGSYQILRCGDASDVVLITNYQAYLHPRHLWRPLEALLVRQLHRHILRGICAAVLSRNPAISLGFAESLATRCTCSGVLACKVSQSCSRR
jgi:hypothetical protein